MDGIIETFEKGLEKDGNTVVRLTSLFSELEILLITVPPAHECVSRPCATEGGRKIS